MYRKSKAKEDVNMVVFDEQSAAKTKDMVVPGYTLIDKFFQL